MRGPVDVDSSLEARAMPVLLSACESLRIIKALVLEHRPFGRVILDRLPGADAQDGVCG